MAKFYGIIGFATTVEDPDNPGVWIDEVVEKYYDGELIKNTRRLQTTSDSTNDSVTISNEISIVANPYAQEHMYAMRYVVFQGIKWKVESVSVEYPRLKLTLGGIYNG